MFNTIKRFISAFAGKPEDAGASDADEDRFYNIRALTPERARAAFFAAVESGNIDVRYGESVSDLVMELSWSGRDLFQQIVRVHIVSTGFTVDRINITFREAPIPHYFLGYELDGGQMIMLRDRDGVFVLDDMTLEERIQADPNPLYPSLYNLMLAYDYPLT